MVLAVDFVSLFPLLFLHVYEVRCPSGALDVEAILAPSVLALDARTSLGTVACTRVYLVTDRAEKVEPRCFQSV